MQILSHRGLWNDSSEKNTIAALEKSLVSGFGFESDIRDYDGRLIISHDIGTMSSPVAEDVFNLLRNHTDQFCFAINIKADGLKNLLKECLARYNIKNYFTFDMSIPQMVEYRDMGITYFTRQSEFEMAPCLYEDAAGVWIDAFLDDSWITQDLIYGHLVKGKKVCLVSPDLHQRDVNTFWENLKMMKLQEEQNIYLCTDIPKEAKKFFDV